MKVTKKDIIFITFLIIFSVLSSLAFKHSTISIENLISFREVFVNYKGVLKEIILLGVLLGLAISSAIVFYKDLKTRLYALIPPFLLIIFSNNNLLTLYLGISLLIGIVLWIFFPTPLIMKNYFSKVSGLSFHTSNIYSKTNLIFFFIMILFFANSDDIVFKSIDNYFIMNEISLSDEEIKELILHSMKNQRSSEMISNEIPQEVIDHFKEEIRKNQEVLMQNLKEKVRKNQPLKSALILGISGFFSFFIFVILVFARIAGFIYFLMISLFIKESEDQEAIDQK